MKPKHLLLTLIVVLIWGINFLAIHSALVGLPPFLLCALRFGLASIPLVFFLPRPKAPLKSIIGYGIFTFSLQFGFLFSGIALGFAPGLASLVLQIQVFFSMGLASVVFKDRPSNWKIIGALISFIGLGIVAGHVDGSATLSGLILILLSALSWSIGNMFSKKVASESPLALVVWGNLIAFPFMIIISLFAEGPALISTSLQNLPLETIIAVMYIVCMSTFVGYGIWGFLLNSYSTAVIAPFTLLIPVIGLLSSAIVLGEGLPSWKLLACFFIMIGLIFNLLENNIRKVFARFQG